MLWRLLKQIENVQYIVSGYEYLVSRKMIKNRMHWQAFKLYSNVFQRNPDARREGDGMTKTRTRIEGKKKNLIKSVG